MASLREFGNSGGSASSSGGDGVSSIARGSEGKSRYAVVWWNFFHTQVKLKTPTSTAGAYIQRILPPLFHPRILPRHARSKDAARHVRPMDAGARCFRAHPRALPFSSLYCLRPSTSSSLRDGDAIFIVAAATNSCSYKIKKKKRSVVSFSFFVRPAAGRP